MTQRFAILIDGQWEGGLELELEEAALQIAEAKRRGAGRIQARACIDGRRGAWRPLSSLEVKALADAAAIELSGSID